MFVVPRLLARQARSAVINVSSVCALWPGGMVPVYSATKAYNFALSVAMRDQFSDKIDVLTVTPNSTATQMNSGRYLFSVSAESHAKTTINQLGWTNETKGHVVHAVAPYIKAIWPLSAIINHVNDRRRKAWIKEEELKKENTLNRAQTTTPGK